MVRATLVHFMHACFLIPSTQKQILELLAFLSGLMQVYTSLSPESSGMNYFNLQVGWSCLPFLGFPSFCQLLRAKATLSHHSLNPHVVLVTLTRLEPRCHTCYKGRKPGSTLFFPFWNRHVVTWSSGNRIGRRAVASSSGDGQHLGLFGCCLRCGWIVGRASTHVCTFLCHHESIYNYDRASLELQKQRTRK
jgi:hypothetical protein